MKKLLTLLLLASILSAPIALAVSQVSLPQIPADSPSSEPSDGFIATTPSQKGHSNLIHSNFSTSGTAPSNKNNQQQVKMIELPTNNHSGDQITEIDVPVSNSDDSRTVRNIEVIVIQPGANKTVTYHH